MSDDRKTAEDAQEAIASYITDMLALEHHIEKAVSGQIADLGDEEPDFVRELRTVHAKCESHIVALESMADKREGGGQGIAGAIKKAASAVLGVGAAGVDVLRTEKLPKDLRDDYTALSLACIGYVMLHTTAKSLGDEPTAQLAQAHLEDHAKCQVSIQNIIPPAVMRFLRDEGFEVRHDQLSEIARTTNGAWHTDEDSAHANQVHAGSFGL